ncbi:MAG: alpha/beta fold hydrolase [Acidimicrobiia bacterium]
MDVSVDGRRAFLHTGGVELTPWRPAILLIHGAGMDHTAWHHQTRALAHAGLAAIAPDLPGHGRSAGPVAASVEEMAAWVVALLDALGIERSSIAGHSMGSLVALETAAAHPERCNRLVLTGTTGAMGVHPDLLAAADRDLALAARFIAGWSFGGRGRMGGHPRSGTWLPGAARHLVAVSPPGALAAGLRACVAYPGLERAASVTAPALVISGTADRMTPPETSARLAGVLESGRLEVLEGAGHLAMAERPREVLQLMREFLAPTIPPP